MNDRYDILVNGKRQTVCSGITVADLLGDLGVDSQRVAVEKNQQIVPRSQHASELIRPGDRLEVVAFVGGGC